MINFEGNEALRALHMERLGHPAAVALYDQLCAACAERPEGLTDAAQHIVGDIAGMEEHKQALYEDVKARGVVVEFINGRQRYRRENKSIQQARMLMEQQRKHLNELRLTPASRKAPAEAVEMEDDEFSAFE